MATRTQRQYLAATVVALILLATIPAPVFSSNPPSDGPASVPEVQDRFAELGESLNGFDWETEHPTIQRAVHNIWKRNGWSSEADRFARDLACEVSAIPPTKPLRRLDLCTERVAQRYSLSDEQSTRFQAMMLREATGILIRNADVIIDQTRQWIEARADGKPFTPEQVAQWSREGRPLIIEMRRSVDRLAKGLEPMLEPSKRRTLERDLQSFEKRRRFVNQMTARWSKGEWRPEDWGLQDDPAHAKARAHGGAAIGSGVGGSPSGSMRGRSNVIPRWVDYDPDTWFAYVLELKKRYDLDAGQMNTAQSIHSELVERANRHIEARAEELGSVPVRQRTDHKAYEPIRQLFSELQDRLEAIPTTSQRDRGKR